MQPSMAVSTCSHQPHPKRGFPVPDASQKSSLAVLSFDWKEEEPRRVVSGGAFLVEYPSAARVGRIAEMKAQPSAADETTSPLNRFIQPSVQSKAFKATAAPNLANR